MHEAALLIGHILSVARYPTNLVPSAYSIVEDEFGTHAQVALLEKLYNLPAHPVQPVTPSASSGDPVSYKTVNLVRDPPKYSGAV